MVDGVGKGDTMDGIPGKDATYTGYHYGAASGWLWRYEYEAVSVR